MKNIKLIFISLILLIIAIIFNEVYYYNISNKLIKTLSLMNVSSKVLVLSTSQIWGDAINKTPTSFSEKYLLVDPQKRYRGVYKFNIAIANFYNEEDTKDIVKFINSLGQKAIEDYKKINYTFFHTQNKRLIEQYYDYSFKLKNYAESPSGNYTSFSNSIVSIINELELIEGKLN